MPIYTFRCEECQYDWDEARHMSEDTTQSECVRCGRTCKRQYRPHNVIQDTFDKPLEVQSLRPVHNPDPKGCDVVYSRSELRKLERAHDEKYGTKLVHAQ